MNEPSYGQMRRAVYQCLTTASVYAALGNHAESEASRRLASEIMAVMPADDFARLVSELRRSRRTLAEPI